VFSVKAVNSTWVLGLASLSTLLVLGAHAWSVRVRGLQVRRWPYVVIGTAFVALFVWIFGPAIGIWFASR
jgi:hypothetical protein